MIDTHCHIDLPAFDDDRYAMIRRACNAGIVGMLVPAIRPNTWWQTSDLAEECSNEGVRCAIGIHPQIVPELDEDELAGDLVAAIAQGARDASAVAIGECGLDGGTAERELQEDIFRAHIRAAREVGLPLVVHVLRAHDTAWKILRDERARDVGGVMHSYSGSVDLVRNYRELGFAFSFAGPVTYPNARRPIEAVRAVPDELLLAETDAPDQTPYEHKGERCEPVFLTHVLDALAHARGVAVGDIVRLTSANARRIFRSW